MKGAMLIQIKTGKNYILEKDYYDYYYKDILDPIVKAKKVLRYFIDDTSIIQHIIILLHSFLVI